MKSIRRIPVTYAAVDSHLKPFCAEDELEPFNPFADI